MKRYFLKRKLLYIMSMVLLCTALVSCTEKEQVKESASPNLTNASTPTAAPTSSTVEEQLPEYKSFIEKAQSGQPINIVFLGGSITAGGSYADWGKTNPYVGTNIDGTSIDVSKYWSYTDDMRDSWRCKVYEWMRTNYEVQEGQFSQINAAIGGTNSEFGALRLEDHVFAQAIPDLIFIEYAVNDNSRAQKDIMSSYESIVSRVREKNPNCAIFIPLSTSRQKSDVSNPGFYDVILKSVGYTRNYADLKKIPYANIDDAYYHSDLTDAQKTALYYGPKEDAGVHPSPYGYEVYAGEVIRVLQECFQNYTFTFNNVSVIQPNAYPQNGKIIFGEDILASIPGSTAEALKDDPRLARVLSLHKMLKNTDASQEFQYSFQGTGLWLWMDLASSNVIINVYVDDILVVSGWRPAGQQVQFVKGYLAKDVLHTVRIVSKGTAVNTKPYCFALRGLLIENYTQ